MRALKLPASSGDPAALAKIGSALSNNGVASRWAARSWATSRFAELTQRRTDLPGRLLTVKEAAEAIREPVSFVYMTRGPTGG